jgi:hypothetical protein
MCLWSTSVFVNLNESSERAVISPFYIIREKTGWEFFHAPVILDAFATDSLSAARLIGAVAFFHNLFSIAFFHCELLKNNFLAKSCSLYYLSLEFFSGKDEKKALALGLSLVNY